MHDEVFAFLRPDLPAAERPAQGLQALLARAVNQQTADKRLQLVYRGYELVPMSRGRLGVLVHARAVRWLDGRLAGLTEGKEFLVVLPAGAEPDELVAAATDACDARRRIVEQAFATVPEGWSEDVLPGQLLGTQHLPWGGQG